MSGLAPLARRRFLVTGAGGMLGRAFAERIAASLPEAPLRALGKAELDVSDAAAVDRQAAWAPEIIVHCAAWTNADACEAEPDTCHRVQVGGTANIARLARRLGATVLYPQSFLVHDGASLPIHEDTPPRPLSTYGRAKLLAEELLRGPDPRALIVRMGGFFGGEAADKNFVGRFLPAAVARIEMGERTFTVGDRVWQPTYTIDLADNCLHLLAAGATGVYCMASHGYATFYDLAVACFRLMGLPDGALAVTKVPAHVVSGNERAQRPEQAIMENRRLQREGLDLQRDWRLALAEYLAKPMFRALAARAQREVIP